MTLSLTFGTWVFPAIFTFLALIYCIIQDRSNKPGYSSYGNLGNAIISAFWWVPAIVLSLCAWLLWALYFK